MSEPLDNARAAQRQRRIPRPLVNWRFEEKFNRGKGCWEWRGAKKGAGYAGFLLDGKHIQAHRAAYAAVYGPIPAGLYVCHHCDNKRCVNPRHLFVGTAKDNNNDAYRKGIMKPPPVTRFPGEANPRAVLTERDVALIRALVWRDIPQAVLAEVFGVSRQQLSNIARGECWAGEES